MGKELYDEHRVVQEYFEEAAECVSINFVKLCFASSDVDIATFPQGPLALFVIEAASSGLLRDVGIVYEAAAGVDMVSWYASVHAAQAMNLPDCLYMLRKWAELFAKAVAEDGHMQRSLAVAISRPETFMMVSAWCEQLMQRELRLRVVRVTDREVIIVGTEEAVKQLEEMVQKEGMTFERREAIEQGDVLMPDESLVQIQHYLAKVDFKTPACPVANVLRGGYSTTAEELKLVATELVTQPLQADRVYKDIALWKELIVSVPALRSKEHLIDLFPDKQVWTMETASEFEAMRASLTTSQSLPEVE